MKLRKISNEVFQLLVKLRRPTDPLGTRFNTVCHGDMWMGNLMFRHSADLAERRRREAAEEAGHEYVPGGDTSDVDPESADPNECTIIDFHSAQFLSPATDLAHLLLTRKGPIS